MSYKFLYLIFASSAMPSFAKNDILLGICVLGFFIFFLLLWAGGL